MQFAVVLFPAVVMTFALGMERLEGHLTKLTVHSRDVDAIVAESRNELATSGDAALAEPLSAVDRRQAS